MPVSKVLNAHISQYSFEDLAKSFFILNTWLPNVASPVKSQFLYVILESLEPKLSNENQIVTYEDFKDCLETILSLLPSFPMLEDYVPEADWGEIKYFFNDNFYNIFYGGDMANIYDYYSSFEIIHLGFDDFYQQHIDRSPMEEFEFCLKLQDEIIKNINQKPFTDEDIDPGEFTIPPQIYWEKVISFLDNYNPAEIYGKNTVAKYTNDFDIKNPRNISIESDFGNGVYEGTNCPYFFIKKGGKIFPVLPRNYFSVLFETWGEILNNQYKSIEQNLEHYEKIISWELSKFINTRSNNEKVYSSVCAIHPDLKPHETIFTSAFISKNRLVLVNTLPPKVEGADLEEYLNKLTIEYIEAKELLSNAPTQLGLMGEGRMVRFDSPHKNISTLKPLFITCVPFFTSRFDPITLPEDLPGQVLPIQDFLGVFDELTNLDEFAEFFDYLKQRESIDSFINPMLSKLDHFGAFKDSDSVIIEGAIEPDMLMIDPHWGSNYRYRSLMEFWQVYPEETFFGHPRSWFIEKELTTEKSLMIHSKNFFSFIRILNFADNKIYSNAPVHLLDYSQGRLTDLLMSSLHDAFRLYEETLTPLPFANAEITIHILFFPNSLLDNDEDFNHLSHLSPIDSNWKMDIVRLRLGQYGIRVVYNENALVKKIQNAEDRSLQIELLIDAVKQLNNVFGEEGFAEIEKELENEKNKKNRYRMFSMEKQISFPDFSQYIVPESREYKLANKLIAQTAYENSISEGVSEGKEAKEKIKSLINGLVTKVNTQVESFDFEKSIPLLISNVDSLSNEHVRETSRIKDSLTQDVEYEREISAGNDKSNFLHGLQLNSYLIEKFVQLQPKGKTIFTKDNIAELLALVDRLLSYYGVSDSLHYGIYPAKLIISSNFTAQIEYNVDISEMRDAWLQEKAKISLEMIGNEQDKEFSCIDYEKYIEEMDESFQEDLGFTLRELIAVQKTLCAWAIFNKSVKENTYYKENLDAISTICDEVIEDFDITKTKKILDFLTLDSEKILSVEGNPNLANDLPVWEYRKRTYRYGIRPVIKIGDYYYWGAHSVDHSGRIWFGILNRHKLPSDIPAPNTAKTLDKYHQKFRSFLQDRAEEIVKRTTHFVETEVFPKKLGFSKEEIGDIDVFAYLKDKNILLNIETKVIDQAFCYKDIKRLSEKIFGRLKTSDGTFSKGYIQKVERRGELLKEKGEQIAKSIWKDVSDNPKVVSIFVTPESYWWTKYPPFETDIHFVEIRLLEDFIENLLTI